MIIFVDYSTTEQIYKCLHAAQSAQNSVCVYVIIIGESELKGNAIMRKNIIIIFLLSVMTGVVTVFYCGVCGTPSRDELIEQSFADAADINSTSYFGEHRGEKCFFLSEPKGECAVAMPYHLGRDDSFCYFPYADRNCLSEIVFSSPEYNLYGITTGDSVAQAGALLEQKGFSFEGERIEWLGSYHSTVYCKGYITVALRHDPETNDDPVTRIMIKACDPQYSGVILN